MLNHDQNKKIIKIIKHQEFRFLLEFFIIKPYFVKYQNIVF